MNKPDWKDAPEWANWLAQDESCEWFWFEYKPVRRHDDWGVKTKGRYANANFYNESWKETLERRP